jgi:hypothetical protein
MPPSETLSTENIIIHITYQLPPPGIDPDRALTLPELAAAIGPGRSGRPTRPATVREWCLRGIAGVVLDSWAGAGAGERRTTWRKYQRFLSKVAGRQEELRRERRKAVRPDSGMGPAAPKRRKK